MTTFNISSTVKAIFAGERATTRLADFLFDDKSTTTPNPDSVSALVAVLNKEHSGNKDKCAAINMKVNRMSHSVAAALELVKGNYKALAIKLDDDGQFYAELVATRATTKDPLMEAAKAFKKSHSQADMDKLMKAAMALLEMDKASK